MISAQKPNISNSSSNKSTLHPIRHSESLSNLSSKHNIQAYNNDNLKKNDNFNNIFKVLKVNN